MKIKRAYAPVEETDGIESSLTDYGREVSVKKRHKSTFGWNLLRQVMNYVSGSVMTPTGLQSSLNDIVQS